MSVPVDHLPRNRDRIWKALAEQPDGSVRATEALEVYFPKRFSENGMAVVEEAVVTAAVIGIVIPGECYTPLIALADIILHPLNIRETNVSGEGYFVLEFDKGDTVIDNLEVIADTSKPHYYQQEFNFNAKLPWYVGLTDLTGMYDNAQQECGRAVGSVPQVMRVFNAIMLRDPENVDVPYRNSAAMEKGVPPEIVGLNNGSMLIDGTFSKITSGYLQDNTVATIINPDTRVTDLEAVIRGIPI